MVYILDILLIVYTIIYISSRPKKEVVMTKRRVFVFACVLSAMMLGQTFHYVNRPPKVNYYETGWWGFIKYLNDRFAANGNPNRIPTPSNQ